MEPLKAFLDANVLFSAAIGGQAFERLWSLSASKRVTLVTSRTCVIEAERNLRRKRRDTLRHLELRLSTVSVFPDVANDLDRWQLPPKDAPIYATAVAIDADVFITGDLRHFGALMDEPGVPVQVRTVRAFLLRGPR